MKTAMLTAGCKINLHLEILSRREDGYHELRTLFYPLAKPNDDLEITPGPPGQGLQLRCNIPELETERNIVHKAWQAFGQATGFAPDLSVRLEKRIPSGAGLGGGSSDAAALLRWLNSAARDQGLDDAALLQLAAGLGADVPFFLLDGPAWAEGIGERLTPCDVSLAGLHMVLIQPDVAVSTAWAYRAWDEAQKEDESTNAKRPNFSLTATPAAPILSRSNALWLYNSFESVVFEAFSQLRRIRETALSSGAAGALMSGSGSALFALFRTQQAAKQATGKLQKLADVRSVWTLTLV